MFYDSDSFIGYLDLQNNISSQKRAQAVAKLLTINSNMTHVQYYNYIYDESSWNDQVVPLLKQNNNALQSKSSSASEAERDTLWMMLSQFQSQTIESEKCD